MPLQAPNLDDRRFADLFSEARGLIPRYAPEWTDHNESDPGITLLELDAWLHETILYRLNQLPERTYIKFLQLLGIELMPARPAQADITFKLSRKDVDAVIVPKGTRIAGPGGDDGQPVLFETERAGVALGMLLAEIQSFDGRTYSSETKKNAAAGQFFYPFGVLARETSALVLGFDSPLKFTAQQIDLMFYIAETVEAPKPRQCSAELMSVPVPVTLAWEFYTGTSWQPLTIDLDGSRAFTQSGHVLLRGPGDKLAKSALGQVKTPLYWLRARLVRGTYEAAPRLSAVMTNTFAATQSITVRDEVLGGSDASPNQTFTLANTPVLSLTLEVDEGTGFKAWVQKGDLSASGPDDPDYTLNATTGQVTFGDGVNGRIPTANLANPTASVVAREYRWGGGKRGNLAAGLIQDLQTFVEGADSASNGRPSQGGSDEETVAQAKRRASDALKNKGRAVTAEDFESIAKSTPLARVLRAKALPLTMPQFPGVQIPGAVTVIVVPEGDGPRPTPTEATLRAVCQCLNQARLLTTDVWVMAPVYRTLSVEAEIIVNGDEDLATVKRAIEDRLKTFLDPLKGGPNGEGWDFGGTVFYSQIYRIIIDTPGVDRIDNNQMVLWLDGVRGDFCRDVPIQTGELITSESHDIRVKYAIEGQSNG
jgi:predicted phage baseplate assembly protein